VGISKVIDLAHRFGVTSDIPPYLPIALGAASITLDQQMDSYSVFPNDGIRVTPRLIRKVENYDGITLWQDRPAIDEIISQETARSMMTLLRAVTTHGTGAAVAQLNHPLGGKTGTTSDFTNAWFLGFSPSVTCGVWVGFDNEQSLGEKETGARAALPIWMTFMKAVIAGAPDEQFPGDEAENVTADGSGSGHVPGHALDKARPADSVAASGRAGSVSAAKQGGSSAARAPHL
jgi:penicillin-binding protein 1A